MKVSRVFISFETKDAGDIYALAHVIVPGLGDVEIRHALSVELCDQIAAQSVAALRVKLGQVIQDEKEKR